MVNYVFIDESGHLGGGEARSGFFIITAVLVSDDSVLIDYKRIPKRIKQRRLKKAILKKPELKFSNSSVLIIEQYLKRVSRLDLRVFSVIFDKVSLNDRIIKDLSWLYFFLMKSLIEEVLKNVNGKVSICLDKSMSSRQRDLFDIYLRSELFSKLKDLPEVLVSHEGSAHNVALQVTDFVCGAFGYKYNTARLQQDYSKYTSIISSKIMIEKIIRI